uniref:uncharacterized protein LOC100185802 isoform X2 n=1 Tax=Ciona intestinalis TaxID=7719 RepID=UPI000EF4D14A|nr:uncharacterized protein LOC100185802 isoform X2 [Ciona intestinalis]|eukprot:XP_026689553.1 uncharacterized protein LOC100185802 isoform X2 [Ciona intestinalis]
MGNTTWYNYDHHVRMCSKASYYTVNHTFNVYSDCSVAGISLLITITIILIVTSIFGNLLAVVVIHGNKNYWNPYGICRVWLALWDSMTGILYMPAHLYIMINVFFKEDCFSGENKSFVKEAQMKVYGNTTLNIKMNAMSLQIKILGFELMHDTVIVLMSFVLATYILMTPWILMVMSVDRYVAIVFPFKYSKWSSKKKMVIILLVATVIVVFCGTVWPLAHLELFSPGINNRFGIGATFIFGRFKFFESKEIMLYFLTWGLPLLVVCGFGSYTAYYCLNVIFFNCTQERIREVLRMYPVPFNHKERLNLLIVAVKENKSFEKQAET